MFTESLLESGRRPPPRRRWTALLSAALQAGTIALLLLLPLLSPSVLPPAARGDRVITPFSGLATPPSRGEAAPRHRARRVSRIDSAFRAPGHIPRGVPRVTDDVLPAVASFTDGSGMPGLSIPGAPAAHYLLPRPVLPQPAPPPPPRVSVPQPATPVLRVEPRYPTAARIAAITGEVVLHAVISRDGRIEELRPLSGHPLLAAAAMDAVRQWRYHPYLLNGQPVEVETQITVRFHLLR